MITTRTSIHGFPWLSYNYGYGIPLGCPTDRRSSAITVDLRKLLCFLSNHFELLKNNNNLPGTGSGGGPGWVTEKLKKI